MKHLLIEINCGEKTCTACTYLQWSSCALFMATLEIENNIPLRCEQCKNCEVNIYQPENLGLK